MRGSVWEEYYRRYRLLQDGWRCPGAPAEIEKQAFSTILTSPKEPRLCLTELHRWGFEGPGPDQLYEALELRGVIQTLPEGWFPDEPLADVYQAALRMETYETWKGDKTRRRIYRGQRDHSWPITPKIFRRRPVPHSEGEGSSLTNDLNKVCSYVRAPQASWHDITDEEGVAIIQHYSAEMNAATWLIDFTWDPFITLFFASDGGQAEDIGKISYLGIGEWDRFSAGGTNRLGRIRLIEPKGVQRIVSQHALFLDTSHPDLLEQFVPHSLYFRQVRGLVFEDGARTPAVTRAVLYPAKDPYKEELMRAQPPLDPDPLDYLPTSDASRPLCSDDYLEIIQSWYRHRKWPLNEDELDVLRGVSFVHASMQSPEARRMIEITGRSLHRLEEAVLRTHELGADSLSDAFDFLLNRPIDPRSREAIVKLIHDATVGAS